MACDVDRCPRGWERPSPPVTARHLGAGDEYFDHAGLGGRRAPRLAGLPDGQRGRSALSGPHQDDDRAAVHQIHTDGGEETCPDPARSGLLWPFDRLQLPAAAAPAVRDPRRRGGRVGCGPGDRRPRLFEHRRDVGAPERVDQTAERRTSAEMRLEVGWPIAATSPVHAGWATSSPAPRQQRSRPHETGHEALGRPTDLPTTATRDPPRPGAVESVPVSEGRLVTYADAWRPPAQRAPPAVGAQPERLGRRRRRSARSEQGPATTCRDRPRRQWIVRLGLGCGGRQREVPGSGLRSGP